MQSAQTVRYVGSSGLFLFLNRYTLDMGSIDEAFKEIPRRLFVPESSTDLVEVDSPIPIGFGQTNSQPSTVRLMLGWLDVEPGDKILDVGSGSGWTTALLARLTGPKGKVYAVERIPELVDIGEQNARTAGVNNAQFFKAGRNIGLKKFSPYDRILVSASAKELPLNLLDQLKLGGKLVIPVHQDILEIEKGPLGQIEINSHPGFVFVPLIDGLEN